MWMTWCFIINIFFVFIFLTFNLCYMPDMKINSNSHSNEQTRHCERLMHCAIEQHNIEIYVCSSCIVAMFRIFNFLLFSRVSLVKNEKSSNNTREREEEEEGWKRRRIFSISHSTLSYDVDTFSPTSARWNINVVLRWCTNTSTHAV